MAGENITNSLIRIKWTVYHKKQDMKNPYTDINSWDSWNDMFEYLAKCNFNDTTKIIVELVK